MAREVEARLKISAVDRTGRVLQQIGNRLQQVNRQAASVTRQQAMLSKATSQVNAVMLRYMAPAAIAAATAGAVKSFASVERQMTRIGITADASAAETEAALQRMQELSKGMALPLDSAVSAVDTLVSSGLSLKEAMDFLPSVLATAQASGSATEDIANTAIKASSALKIQTSEMQRAFDIMVMGGKAGQFELKDMAAYIPELANSFASLGYTGEEGLKQLIAVLQTLREDAGSASAAATQAQNIFGKMFTEETAKKFAKFGIDLRREMDAAKASGEDALSAFVRLSKEALKGDLSKLPLLFTDQEFRLGMQSLITSPEALEKFLKTLNSAEVDGTVFRDLQRVTGDTQASIDRLANSWDKLIKSFGGAVAGPATAAMDAVSGDLDRGTAIRRALEKRGLNFFEREAWMLKNMPFGPYSDSEEADRMAIEGGYSSPELREKYDQGPRLPVGWKPEVDFSEEHEGPSRKVRGADGRWHDALPSTGPVPTDKRVGFPLPKRDPMTAAMIARRGEIAYANGDLPEIGVRPEQRNADLQRILSNLERVEKGGGGRPWMGEGDKIGTEVGAAAIERMSSDAGSVGNEISSVVQEALKAIAPSIGTAIAQAFAATASQVKLGVNVPGNLSKPTGDTGRTMPTSVGLPASTGG